MSTSTPRVAASPIASTPERAAATAPTCGHLDVDVSRLPGGGGVSYALVSVTSRETAPCTLPGIPTVRLLDASRTAQTPVADAEGAGGPGLVLAPGELGSTLLQDRTATCTADVRSTYVEVRATPAADAAVTDLALPPCTLAIRPFTAGSDPSP